MKILLPVNDTPASRAAAQFVASRCDLLGANPKVVLISAQLPLSSQAARVIGAKQVRSIHRHDADLALKPVQRILADAGIKAPALIALGPAGERIAAAADKTKADLIIMGSRGLGALKGLFFGSVTNAVLAHTQVPILVLRGKPPLAVAQKVGIAIDGSAFGKAAVRFVVKHREWFGMGSKFTLIHVAPDFVMPALAGLGGAAAPIWGEEELKALQDASFARAIPPATEKLKVAGLAFDEARLIGSAGDRIAEYVKKHKLDLLVLGSHGYGGFKAAVLGSVAARVASRCNTPMLLIRRA